MIGIRKFNLISALLFLAISTAAQSQGATGEFRFNVEQFTVSGDNPLGDSAQDVLQPYVGDQFGLDGLAAAADALEQALVKAGYSFHRVSLPPQALDSGVVNLEVIRFRIGEIKITGNQHFDEENLLNALPQLRSGETPNTQAMSRSLKLANNHASKKVGLKFRESEQGNGIDAELAVKDQSPQMVFISADNTGSRDSEEIRTTIGYQHGNLFNKDHSLTATLTVAPEDVDATTQIGLAYRVPMYSHGATMDFLLSDSEINSGSVANGTAVTGQGSVFAFTYTRPIMTEGNFEHQWTAGVQYKNFENEINLGGGLLVNSEVLSAPLDLGYSFNWRQQRGALSGGINLLTNLQSSAGNDADYAAVRTGATSDWTAYRYRLAYDRLIGDNWLAHLGVSGQQSDDILVSGEQFGVGGMSTLRGFEERTMLGDFGYQVSAELWFPPVYQMRFLVFVDAANVEKNENAATVGTGTSFDLQSVGLGMRWSWKQQLSISVDYGKITKGILATEDINVGSPTPINLKDDDKAHFSLVYRF